jgi:hypothetical protein
MPHLAIGLLGARPANMEDMQNILKIGLLDIRFAQWLIAIVNVLLCEENMKKNKKNRKKQESKKEKWKKNIV